jgi:2-polyprenyl-6-methoxyphenol hydroxylase-like FAD-dependent oxidoreductase
MRALIVGGGIGGVTTAMAMRKAGIDATVFERAADIRHVQVGSGIDVWPNGINVLRQINPEVVDRLRERSAVTTHMTFMDWRSRNVLVDFPVGEWSARAGGWTLGVRRGDLHDSLASGLEDGVLELGRSLTSFVQDAGGVIARFEDGSEERGDVLVGADGFGSTVRGQLLGESKPRYSGHAIWQGYTDLEHELAPNGRFPLYVGRGRRFVFLHVDADTICWIGIANDAEGTTVDDVKGSCLERFSGWAAPTAELIESTPPEGILHLDVYDREPVKRWSEGRVTLLGDAAHPMTFDAGQGAMQAIEDGLALTRALERHDDVPSALRAYEAGRVPRTTELVKMARMVGTIFDWENPVVCALRNWILLRGVFARVMPRQQQKLISHTID